MRDARTVVFTVPGRAVPKERPRLGKGGHVYTPTRTKQYEETVAWCALASGLRLKAGDRVRVTAIFWLCPRTGDGDNRQKAVLDGLQRAFPDWDDRDVVSGSWTQIAAMNKKMQTTVVTIEVME